ncbi:SAF domain-containing protein [Frankia gtarii]|uniref:SAF domain-containing protein n=1 Tax=Frankia gtarii TaxID=2950102 RepID=UPI0021BF04F1|nr:SAF domain-containing protein [Frankia gtarii]
MTATVGATPVSEASAGMPFRPRPASRRGMAIAVLLMVLGAGGAVGAATWHDDHVDAVVLTRPVARGEIVDTGDLAVARVSVEGTSARLASPTAARAAIVGRQALINLTAGMLITPEMVGSALPPAGSASVGVRLPVEALPSRQLRAGDWVQVVVAAGAGAGEGDDSPTLVGGPVQVADVRAVSDQATSGDMVVYLDAPADDAARIASAAGTSGQGLRLLGVRR